MQNYPRRSSSSSPLCRRWFWSPSFHRRRSPRTQDGCAASEHRLHALSAPPRRHFLSPAGIPRARLATAPCHTAGPPSLDAAPPQGAAHRLQQAHPRASFPPLLLILLLSVPLIGVEPPFCVRRPLYPLLSPTSLSSPQSTPLHPNLAQIKQFTSLSSPY